MFKYIKNIFQGKPFLVKCFWCGKEYYVDKEYKNEKNFCSENCVINSISQS